MSAATVAGTLDVRPTVDNAEIADVVVAAGSVIEEDVSPGAPVIARSGQVEKEGRGGERDD